MVVFPFLSICKVLPGPQLLGGGHARVAQGTEWQRGDDRLHLRRKHEKTGEVPGDARTLYGEDD